MSEHTAATSVFSEREQRLLVERVKLAPSREWTDQYFDLVASLLNALGCENGDPRLVTSIPDKKYKIPMHLPVVTNARYALSPDLPYAHDFSDVPVDGQYVPRSKTRRSQHSFPRTAER